MQTLIDRVVAATPHCSRHHVELAFGYSEDEWVWTCRIRRAVKHQKRAKTLRPLIEGYGSDQDAAVEEALAAVERWKDPEAAAAKNRQLAALQIAMEMHAKGDITDEQLANIRADTEGRTT